MKPAGRLFVDSIDYALYKYQKEGQVENPSSQPDVKALPAP